MSTGIDIFDHVHNNGRMKLDHALLAFSALSQETRLKVFKILVEYGPTGTPAGTVSERLGIPHNTLSFHLAHLSHTHLVSSRKVGRSVIYSANCEMIEELIAFLSENCCVRETSDTTCGPCCPPQPKRKKRT
jgi:ArsR family transcriptional regulator, arsenate/arsenite/antimonite-responsive transcriptional repressor